MAGKGAPPGVHQGGRKKGTPNKSTAQIRELAQKHAPEAIAGIIALAKTAEHEATRLAAWRELLDRGYGKPKQPIGGDDDGAPIEHIVRIIVGARDRDG